MNGYLSIFRGILSTDYNQLDAYLDGLQDHQGFSVQIGEADEVVQNISSLLTKGTTRALGLRLLSVFLDQCGIDIFERKSNLWTTLVLKACNVQEMQSSAVITFEVLGKLATKSQQIPDLSKSFASSHLSKVYESLNNVPISSVKYALRCVETCLRLYPGSSGPSRGIIERFLWKFLDSGDKEVVSICGKCLQLLQQVRGGGLQGVNHKMQWKNYNLQLLGSIHGMFNELFKNCTEIYDENVVEDQLLLTSNQLEYDHEPVKRAAQLFTRCHNLINFLIISLREPFPVEKPIQLKKILNVVYRGLSVTCIMLEQNPSADNFAIGLLLPKLHIDLLELLNTIIVIMRGYMRSHSQLVLSLLMDVLKWTSTMKSYNNQKPLLNLRAKAYDSIALWCKVLQSGCRCESIAEFLCHEIINDVTPLQSEFTLKVLSGARKHMSKKARRQLHKAQNDQSKMAQTHSNDNSIRKEFYSEERNQILCVSALRCLQEVLLSGANFMKPTTIKLIHTHITQICAIFYELSIKPNHLYYNYQCRLQIYKTLSVMLMTPHHLCPPPTEIILTIIQAALIRDDSFKVRNSCGVLLQNLEKIIHPQKESLLFLIEARDVRNTFIKMGQENLLHVSALNFSNSNSDDDEKDDFVQQTSEMKAAPDQQYNEQQEDDINDIIICDTDTSTDHADFEKQISEEHHMGNSPDEDSPKSPQFVLRVDDDVEDIAAIEIQETTGCDVDLTEPAIKKVKIQEDSGTDDACKFEIHDGSVALNNNSVGSDKSIVVDDDTLLADIASQFVDELN